jgi:hypothetical protein
LISKPARPAAPCATDCFAAYLSSSVNRRNPGSQPLGSVKICQTFPSRGSRSSSLSTGGNAPPTNEVKRKQGEGGQCKAR